MQPASAAARRSSAEIHEALRGAPVFSCLDPVALRRLALAFTRVHLRAGATLVTHGDVGDALFVVVHGRLRVLIGGESGDRVLGEVGSGETVGEMAVLTGETRLGTVVAVRDSELLRMGRADFERLAAAHPRVMLDLTRLLLSRYRDTLRSPFAAHITTLALVHADASGATRGFCRQLVSALRLHRERVAHVGEAEGTSLAVPVTAPDDGQLSARLHDLEHDNDLVVYETGPAASPWAEACLRQADVVLVVGMLAAHPHAPAALVHARTGALQPRTELALLRDPGMMPAGTDRWLDAVASSTHHHVAIGVAADVQRVARCLLGHATGLVLGGGGARGLAHIGVLRALAEANIPVDRVGGTSAGANIGAMHALGWSWEHVLEETRRTFVDRGSLQDFTLPIHSLLRGRRYHRIGEELYGDRRIEDLPLRFFCVSTNLTRGQALVHRAGLVRRALRASMTVPGIAPAVFEGREVLVDGGVINNLPVDVMRDEGRGRVIAVNVSPQEELRLDDDYGDTPSPWSTVLDRLRGRSSRIPTIASILTRTATIPRAALEADPRRQPDLLLEPPVARFRLLQWSAIDALVEIGYRHATEQLASW